MYGVPHGRGSNLLMYDPDEVSPAPTSWDVVFDNAGEYSGQVTAYDNPIYIADAALYLREHQPDLGIEDPYELDQEQFDAAIALLQEQSEHVGEYWSDYTKEISAFANGDSSVGTTWQVISQPARRRWRQGRGRPPRGGRDRLVRHLDDQLRGRASELHVHVDGPHHQPGGERRRGRMVR